MTWPIEFHHQIPFQDGEFPDYPCVVATILANGIGRTRKFYVDTGAARTVITTDLAVALGVMPPADADIDAADAEDNLPSIGCRRFGGASGGPGVIGFQFGAMLSVEGGPQGIQFNPYGVVRGNLLRNLLGRDFFEIMDAIGLDQSGRATYFRTI